VVAPGTVLLLYIIRGLCRQSCCVPHFKLTVRLKELLLNINRKSKYCYQCSETWMTLCLKCLCSKCSFFVAAIHCAVLPRRGFIRRHHTCCNYEELVINRLDHKWLAPFTRFVCLEVKCITHLLQPLLCFVYRKLELVIGNNKEWFLYNMPCECASVWGKSFCIRQCLHQVLHIEWLCPCFCTDCMQHTRGRHCIIEDVTSCSLVDTGLLRSGWDQSVLLEHCQCLLMNCLLIN